VRPSSLPSVRTGRASIRSDAVVPLAVVVAVLALAGCGGSAGNGIASKTPAEILAASRAAATSATSVNVVSKASQGRLGVTLSAQLASDGGRAQLSVLGVAFEVIRIGKTVYVKGSLGLYKSLGIGIAAKVPRGSWLTGPVSGKLGQFATFTDLSSELNRLLPASNALLAKGPTATLDGQHVLELNATAKLFTGVLYVPTTGRPYPIELTKHGRETGQSTFSEWDKPITLNPPANAIQLSQLEHKSH
jgi:hypothetical protein